MSRNILVVDDEQSIRDTVGAILKDEGYRVITANSGKHALEVIRSERPDLVLLDIWMPEMDGLDTLREIKLEWPDQTVIMMSGHGTIETAVKSTKLGAFDFVEKPLSLEKILVLVQNALSLHELARENQALRKQVQKQKVLVGESQAIKEIQDKIKRVAPTTGSVLITGENGTGKELVAHGIHTLSQRFNKPFVEVNCAAIPDELIESELFGHEKGSFTGATNLRRGKFDLAHGGTLFLDEIGDMSLKTQAKVLRILQEQKFERVGGSQTIAVDVRIVAATNKDLKAEIAAGRFREDLYYRLNVVPFVVPPLRDRSQDIVLLAEHFLKEFSAIHNKLHRKLSKEAAEVLEKYSWPGNVRELKNLIERIMILTAPADEGQSVRASDILSQLSEDERNLKVEGSVPEADSNSVTVNAKNLKDARHEFEKEMILKALKENEFNVSKTASVLGIERSHLHRKMKTYGIESQ